MPNQLADQNTVAQRDLFMIDGAAPFFAPFIDGTRKNWSKAPLHALQQHGQIPAEIAERICTELTAYCQRVREIGYTAITFDDLAHLTLFDFYPYLLSRTVHAYQQLFRRVFAIARAAGLQIFITTDLMFWNRFIETRVRGRGTDRRLRELFVEALERLFDLFPEVAGVVTRIGEADGVDVESLFKSRLHIRTPRQCNRWLKEALPVFEAHNKLLVFRTWGLGAYAIGDLIWNETTEKRAFAAIDSPAFVVSRKFGTADFFRYLPLNPRIVESQHQQIIELQARREYEGFGAFPNYVGRQYQAYRDQLARCDTLRGISVWCQTGGWSHFDRLTFLENSSPWNELNAVAALQLFTSSDSAEEILRRFCQQRFPAQDVEGVIELVGLFDQLLDQLWYFAPFACKPIWFRRLRVPPLLWIFWDTVIVNRALRLVFRAYLDDPEEIRRSDKQQRDLLGRMRQLIKQVGVEQDGLQLGADSLRMLYTLRRFYLGKGGPKREQKIAARLQKYHAQHPTGLQVECDFSPFRLRWVTTGALFGTFMRRQARYRLVDRLLLIPLTGWFFPVLKRWQSHRIPDLADRQALGLELFFR